MGFTEQQISPVTQQQCDNRTNEIDRLIGTRKNPTVITVEDVRSLDQTFRLRGGKKQIFGRAIQDLVERGFLFTEDMYRTTTFGPIAQEAASCLVEVLEEYFPKEQGQKYKGIEGCTGAGSQTWALANQHGKLWIDLTVEKDSTVALYTRKNLSRLGLNGLQNATMVDDIENVFRASRSASNGSKREYDWVMVDPDWLGKPYKSKKQFHLREMDPNGQELVGLGLLVAPVVGIKAPDTVTIREISDVAKGFGVAVVVRDMELQVGEEMHKERFAYFIDNPELIAESSIKGINYRLIKIV